MNISEALKDAKIAELLEQYIALEEQINNIPQKVDDAIGDLKNRIESIPDRADEKIEIRFKKLIEISENIEKDIGDDLNEIKKKLLSSIRIEVQQATRELQTTAQLLSSNKRPLKAMILTAIVCSIAAGLSSWAGAYLYNINNVETLRKEIAFYQLYQQADEVGYLAIGNQFSEKQQKKNDDVYREAMGKKFKELIEKSDLGNFRPKEFKY